MAQRARWEMENKITAVTSVEGFKEWLRHVMQPASLEQLAAIVGLGVAAWLATRFLRKSLSYQAAQSAQPDASAQSPLFLGVKGYDGMLFPILWWLGVYLASLIMQVTVHQSIFRVALPVLFALVLIRMVAKGLRRVSGSKPWARALEHTLSWTIWAGVVLWASGLLPDMLQALGSTQIKLGSIDTNALNVLVGSIFAVVALLGALWASSAIEARLLRDAVGSALSLRKIISNGIRGVLLFLSLVIGLKAMHIDLTAFSVFGGALGVGIGLGLQKLAANYVSGFVVLMERNIRIGDMVEVDGFEGRVTDISARFTRLRSIYGVETILPNEMLVNQRVENRSLNGPLVKYGVSVGVAYNSDMKLVQRLLIEAALAQPRVERDPPPTAYLDSFGDSSLNFKLGFWIMDPEHGVGSLCSAINIQVLESLKAHGVEIPFPQRVVYVHKEDDAAQDKPDAAAALADEDQPRFADGQ